MFTLREAKEGLVDERAGVEQRSAGTDAYARARSARALY